MPRKEAPKDPRKKYIDIWMFPKIGVSQNGWFIMENPITMDDLGYHYCWKHPYIHTYGVCDNHGDNNKLMIIENNSKKEASILRMIIIIIMIMIMIII